MSGPVTETSWTAKLDPVETVVALNPMAFMLFAQITQAKIEQVETTYTIRVTMGRRIYRLWCQP